MGNRYACGLGGFCTGATRVFIRSLCGLARGWHNGRVYHRLATQGGLFLLDHDGSGRDQYEFVDRGVFSVERRDTDVPEEPECLPENTLAGERPRICAQIDHKSLSVFEFYGRLKCPFDGVWDLKGRSDRMVAIGRLLGHALNATQFQIGKLNIQTNGRVWIWQTGRDCELDSSQVFFHSWLEGDPLLDDRLKPGIEFAGC